MSTGWGGGGGGWGAGWWCSYEDNQIMPTGEECLCCRESASVIPKMEYMHNPSCITLYQRFGMLCLHQYLYGGITLFTEGEVLVEKLFCSFFNPLISLYIYYDQYEKIWRKKPNTFFFPRFVSMEMAAIFYFRALTKVHKTLKPLIQMQ